MLSIIGIRMILGIGRGIYLEEQGRENILREMVKVSICNLGGVG